MSHPKASAIHCGYFQYQTEPWIQCFVYVAHQAVVYCLHLVVHNSMSPQALTRGQDNTFVEIPVGGRLGGIPGGGLFSFFRSARFISQLGSWLTLTLPLLELRPQMSTQRKHTNCIFSCLHCIERPLTQRI